MKDLFKELKEVSRTQLINELIQNAKRTNEEVFMVALDFKNAFGTVPHELIFEQMKLKGIPKAIRRVIKEVYKGNETVVELNGTRSDTIPWRRGVIQGCPLSPLLFNLCMDPLLNVVEEIGKTMGIGTEFKGRSEYHTVQAYADDVVLIGRSEEAMGHLLQIVEHFCRTMKLELAPSKCVAIAQRKSRDTNTTPPRFSIEGQEIEAMEAETAMIYLGSPISSWRATRQKSTSRRLQKVTTEIEAIMKSHLSLNQKLVAIRQYIFPTLDFSMISSDVPLTALTKIDTMLRSLIDQDLKSGHLPIPFFYVHAKDGGLGIQNLRERKLTLEITSLMKLIGSKNRKTSDMFRMAVMEEGQYRKVIYDESGLFERWKMEEGELQQEGRVGTNGLVRRVNDACNKLEIRLRIQGRGFHVQDGRLREGEHNNTNGDSGDIINSKKGLKRIKTILRNRWRSELCKLPLHGHMFRTIKDSSVSNNWLRTPEPRNDALTRFLIMARCNQLTTPQIAAYRTHDPQLGQCPICQQHDQNNTGSLMHMLNGCRHMFNLFAWRHNLIENGIVEMMRTKFRNCSIGRSVTLNFTGVNLSDNTKRLKPDITATAGNNLFIIEVNCPYGGTDDREGEEEDWTKQKNKLELRYKEKTEKYKDLIKELKEGLDMRVKFTAIVISSLGVVYEESLNDLMKVFGKRDGKTLAKRLSYLAILGSAVTHCMKLSLTFCNSMKYPILDITYHEPVVILKKNCYTYPYM